MEHKMCVLIFPTNFVRSISYSEQNGDIMNVHMSLRKVLFILDRF